MEAKDALFLKRGIFNPRKIRRKDVICKICSKPLTGKETRNRWIRFIIDIRKKNRFRDVVTDNVVFAGAYCCSEHLLIDMMKQVEDFPNISV